MKTLYLLFVALTDAEGFESMQRVNGVQYKTKLECMAAKAHYKDVENRIQFFCGEDLLYFKKTTKIVLMGD